MRSVRRILALGTAVLLSPLSTLAERGLQQPEPPSNHDRTASGETSKRKSQHADDFLIRGTVFTPEGLSLPGAAIRIRRDTEKRFRWQTMTNSRGEFAVRVKQGSKYEVEVRGKGFREQLKPVDATSGARIEEITLRMEREGGSKQ